MLENGFLIQNCRRGVAARGALLAIAEPQSALSAALSSVQWYASDVQVIRPDLSAEQALQVLLAVQASQPVACVSWPALALEANALYGEALCV